MPLQTTLELPAFQGPLDLLLTLIERRRLAITDVSLAAVADQYLQAVRSLPERDPDLLGEFLVIAARLLLLKSRALLPQADEPDEEESPDDLAERLEEYRRFKEAALALAARFESGEQAFPHPPPPDLQDYQPELDPLDEPAHREGIAQPLRGELAASPEAGPLAALADHEIDPARAEGEDRAIGRNRAQMLGKGRRQARGQWHGPGPHPLGRQAARDRQEAAFRRMQHDVRCT